MKSTAREANHRTAAFQPPEGVLSQIAELGNLPMCDINARWQELFNQDPPTHNRQFLERRIAYQLQENAYRKVNGHVLDRNKERIQALIAQSKRKDPRRKEGLAPGTMLTREYRGRTHIVDVLDDGTFAFEGRPYKSLSRIALEITGAAWSGPAFFGVRTLIEAKQRSKRGPRQ